MPGRGGGGGPARWRGSQGRQPNGWPTRWRPICVKPSFLSRHTGRSVGRWPRLPRAAGAAAGCSRPPRIVQLRLSSSRGSPLWRGGLAEWPVHLELSWATRDHRVAGSAAGCSVLPGSVRLSVQPRAHAVAACHWQVGGLTLPGQGARVLPRVAMAGLVLQVPTSQGRNLSGSAGRPQRLLRTWVLTSRAGGFWQVAGRKLAGSPKLLRKVAPLGGGHQRS
jgi:hypothetical protein